MSWSSRPAVARFALFAAGGVGIVSALLVAVLATGDPSAER